MYAAEKAFDFKCNSTTKEKVVKTVADNFTKEEIDKIGSQGKPVVTNGSKNGDFRAFSLCWIGGNVYLPLDQFFTSQTSFLVQCARCTSESIGNNLKIIRMTE